MRRILSAIVMSVMAWAVAVAQPKYILHSSQMVLGCGDANRVQLLNRTDARAVKLRIVKRADGLCNLAHDSQAGTLYMSKDGSWNTYFKSDSISNDALWTIESTGAANYVVIRNKSNGQCLGTDNTTAGSNVFCDKSGGDPKHQWYLADNSNEKPALDTLRYMVSPAHRLQQNEGWGVSLCWWARMCGGWSDAKIDQLVDWLVSPTGLNYNIFRYNIGGGDDPQNAHCTKHHMGNGKGLRAEMEGFQDERGGDYIWSRDAGQRKIMLKIKEKRPDAIFEAFSNSCPWWMTYSGCCSGNVNGDHDNLNPEYYEDFAHYLVDVCKHYRDEYGIEFRTLEPFNEANTGFWSCNGAQEGCHFSPSSQIAFLRVLNPILKKSGLNTVISAPDETNVWTCIGEFRDYKNAGILNMVGQWNTHTYSSATEKNLAHLGVLARQSGIRLWQSETGSGGSGIGGNLNMAKRLVTDIRYMHPVAWLDWQYVEENNDQWCTVKGSFSNQTMERVKNYYVRQHFSRFIPAGYHYVTSFCDNTLCAINPEGTELVLVALNNTSAVQQHYASLRFCQLQSGTKVYLTNASTNLSRTALKYTLDSEGNLAFSMPAQSIATFVIPISDVPEFPAVNGKEEMQVMLVPQGNGALALTATENKVSIERATAADNQLWTITPTSASNFLLLNAEGRYLSYNSNYALTTNTRKLAGTETFRLRDVDGMYSRIEIPSKSTCLDLQSEATTPGTVVGQYKYNDGGDVSRHWMVLPFGTKAEEDAIADILPGTSTSAPAAIYDLSGRRIPAMQHGINILLMPDGSTRKIMRVCQNAGTPSFHKRSPDFPKPGLCYIKVFL